MPRPLAAILAAALAAASSPAALGAPAPEAARGAAATINEPRCRAHVDFLASDLLEGRATPSRGLDVAAAYLASHFSRLGLEPAGESGTWFQGYPVLREIRLVASALEAGGRSFKYGADYIPLAMSGSGAAEGGLVFAGYGITNEQDGYDDYAGLDVQGKVVLVLRHQPREQQQPSGRGRRGLRHALFTTKIANAARHGARGVLLVTDPVNHEETAPEGAWPHAGDAGPGAEIPAIHVSLEAAQALLGAEVDLRAAQEAIDKDLAPRSAALPGVEVKVAVEVKPEYDTARNVLAMLRGTDLAEECVVVGAHYDHVGVRGEAGPTHYGQIGGAVDGDRIYNGADDNASGTAALLEIARAFAESGLRPRRTVVFAAFSGEELGLVGSEHYVEHPPAFPIGKTAAMINLDMVGRNDPKRVTLGGQQDAALARAIEAANSEVGMVAERAKDASLEEDSDHASFTHAGVPTVFFFAGEHADYHRVTDEAAKIVAEKVARIGRLAFLTAAAVADDPGAGARVKPAPRGRGPGAAAATPLPPKESAPAKEPTLF